MLLFSHSLIIRLNLCLYESVLAEVAPIELSATNHFLCSEASYVNSDASIGILSICSLWFVLTLK